MTKNLFLTSAFALILAACGGGDKAAAPTESPAATNNPNEKVYKVVLDPLYPPFVQQSPKGLEGFDVDVLQAVADKAGFKVSFTPHPWEGVFDTLETGTADIVAGGITVSEERKPKMDFSDTYNEIATTLLVKKDSGIQTFEQAKGKNIAYQLDTSAEAALKKLQNTNELNPLLGSNSAWETVKRVMATDNSKVDATIGDSSTLEYYTKQYPDQNLQVIYNQNLPTEINAFVVKKGNAELLAKINKGLADIKADGTYDKIKERWMGKAQQ